MNQYEVILEQKDSISRIFVARIFFQTDALECFRIQYLTVWSTNTSFMIRLKEITYSFKTNFFSF